MSHWSICRSAGHGRVGLTEYARETRLRLDRGERTRRTGTPITYQPTKVALLKKPRAVGRHKSRKFGGRPSHH